MRRSVVFNMYAQNNLPWEGGGEEKGGRKLTYLGVSNFADTYSSTAPSPDPCKHALINYVRIRKTWVENTYIRNGMNVFLAPLSQGDKDNSSVDTGMYNAFIFFCVCVFPV